MISVSKFIGIFISLSIFKFYYLDSSYSIVGSWVVIIFISFFISNIHSVPSEYIDKQEKIIDEQPVQLFKTALVNNINFKFHQQIPTKDFINDALFRFLKKHIHLNALANHDFSGWNLQDLDLSNANCQAANFSNANLHNVNFINANLKGANFKNADLTGANLGNIDSTIANFEEAKGAVFQVMSSFNLPFK